MNERTIFLNALDEDDPKRRRAYLDSVCAGNAALRDRIEALLRSHQEVDTFLEVPAVEQIIQDDRGLAFLATCANPGSLGRLDHYEVLEIVGRGSTGMVLKGRDTKLQRIVAIKVLKPLLAGSGTARKLFVREAQAAAAVRDDNVIAIYAVSDEGLVPYLVMEYIAGTTLADLINQNGALSLREILRIGMQVARGLAAAHAQGLVHRDIKPCNILLENGVQRVKITDFGLAYAERGVISGTPMFMSPEQARGDPFDHRTDLFSFGSILYTLCTGQPPFPADSTVAVLQRVREDRARPIREIKADVPDWLCDLIGKLHAKDANSRFTSAQEVADLLGRQLELLQRPFAAPPTLVPEKRPGAVSGSLANALERDPKKMPDSLSGSISQRRYLVVVACLAALLLGTLIIYLMLTHPWRQADQRDSNGQLGDHLAGVGKGPVVPLEFRRADIPPTLLALAGAGDPTRAPPELAGMLGDGRFLLPRLGQTAWMDQSPDGKVLAVPLDEDVILFDVPSEKYLRTLKGPGGRVFNVTFSRDSQLLAATTRFEAVGGSVRVWDWHADRVLFTNPQPGPTISCAAAFSPDGKRLYTEGDGRIHGWDPRSGQKLQTLELPPGGISSMCFSPDGRRLAVANWKSCQVKLFDWAGDKFAEVHTELAHRWPVAAVAYSPDGKFLVSGDLQGFTVWNAETLKNIRTVETDAQQLAFSPDSRTFLATTTCDLNTGKEMRRQGHTGHVRGLAFSPRAPLLATCGEDDTVRLWNLAGDGGSMRVIGPGPFGGGVRSVTFTPDGRYLATANANGTVYLLRAGDAP
jgi:serine/threonine protein kinase/WD40 repeat protein